MDVQLNVDPPPTTCTTSGTVINQNTGFTATVSPTLPGKTKAEWFIRGENLQSDTKISATQNQSQDPLSINVQNTTLSGNYSLYGVEEDDSGQIQTKCSTWQLSLTGGISGGFPVGGSQPVSCTCGGGLLPGSACCKTDVPFDSSLSAYRCLGSDRTCRDGYQCASGICVAAAPPSSNSSVCTTSASVNNKDVTGTINAPSLTGITKVQWIMNNYEIPTVFTDLTRVFPNVNPSATTQTLQAIVTHSGGITQCVTGYFFIPGVAEVPQGTLVPSCPSAYSSKNIGDACQDPCECSSGRCNIPAGKTNNECMPSTTVNTCNVAPGQPSSKPKDMDPPLNRVTVSPVNNISCPGNTSPSADGVYWCWPSYGCSGGSGIPLKFKIPDDNKYCSGRRAHVWYCDASGNNCSEAFSTRDPSGDPTKGPWHVRTDNSSDWTFIACSSDLQKPGTHSWYAYVTCDNNAVTACQSDNAFFRTCDATCRPGSSACGITLKNGCGQICSSDEFSTGQQCDVGVCSNSACATPICTIGNNKLEGCLYDGTNFNILRLKTPDGLAAPAIVPGDLRRWFFTALDTDWGSSTPNQIALGNDTFSGKWRGYFTFKPGVYTFTAGSDDGIRVKIDGQTKLDKWADRNYDVNSFQMMITFQVTYLVEVEYYQNQGVSRVKLGWEYKPLPLPLRFSFGDFGNTKTTVTAVSGTTQVLKWDTTPTTTLGYNYDPNNTSCVARGDWSGNKGNQGTETIGPLTLKTDSRGRVIKNTVYHYILDCTNLLNYAAATKELWIKINDKSR